MKKSFILHIDSLVVLDDLTDSQCGELFRAIKNYQSGHEINVSEIVKVAFAPFRNQFIRDDEKYKKTCKKRALAGALGGKQKVANASNCKQTVANVADSDSKSKNDSKNDSDKDNNKKEKAKRFVPPSLGELSDYIDEKRYSVDPVTFINHYESNGWKVGKNKMVSWKSALVTWEKRNHENHKTIDPRSKSAVGRCQIANEERERRRQAQERARNGSSLAEDDRDLWTQADQPIRRDNTGIVGEIIDGDFTRTDKNRA